MNDQANKRILVLGASVLQLPLIQKVKEKGFVLGIVDYDSNAVGVPYADQFFCVSTTDEKGVYEAAREFKADAIVTMATDMPMRAIAYASAKLGLKAIDYETAMRATDKALMIQALAEHNVPHPAFLILEQPNDVYAYFSEIRYPCISKPTDSSGSRGVHKVNSEEELLQYLDYSSECGRSGAVIVEEFMQGQEISVEILCIDGKPHILAVTEKITTGAPYFVELGHTEPGRFDLDTYAAIERVSGDACVAIGIKDGAAHVEIIITDEGPKIVELGARMGGDFITSELVPLSTGIDMMWLMLKIALDENIEIEAPLKKGVAIRYFQCKPGKLTAIHHFEEALKSPGVVNGELYVSLEDEIKEIRSSSDRIGKIIAVGEDAAEASARAEYAVSLVEFVVE